MGRSPDVTVTWLSALLVVAGLVGVVVPLLPGLLLSLAGVLLWAAVQGSLTAWVVLGVCVVVYAAGLVLKFLLPGRRMRGEGVGTATLLLAVVLGIVGFVVLPVLGAPIGFVLGIYLIEHARSGDRHQAWSRTTGALHAILVSTGIELVAGLAMAATWVAGLLLTR